MCHVIRFRLFDDAGTDLAGGHGRIKGLRFLRIDGGV